MNSDEKLLNAILGDEDWRRADVSLKARMLAKFNSRHRALRAMRWSGMFVVLAAITLAAAWQHRISSNEQEQVVNSGRALNPLDQSEPPPNQALPMLTDEELLSFFPPGSCVVAEIDGIPQLIFLDPEMERLYVSDIQSN